MLRLNWEDDRLMSNLSKCDLESGNRGKREWGTRITSMNLACTDIFASGGQDVNLLIDKAK